MLQFKRSHLSHNTYRWKSTEIENSKITGFPHDVLLNTKDGYEMLYFINRYMQSRKYAELLTFIQIERMIKRYIPANKYKHSCVKKWLDFNFRAL